jgi:hypothetical protein
LISSRIKTNVRNTFKVVSEKSRLSKNGFSTKVKSRTSVNISYRSVKMGNWWSKITASSIDVSGNDNQVIIIKGVHYDWSQSLNDLRDCISRQNQAIQIILITSLMVIIIMSIVFYLSMMRHREESRLAFTNVRDKMESLNRNIQTIEAHMHSSSITTQKEQERMQRLHSGVNCGRLQATLRVASVHKV